MEKTTKTYFKAVFKEDFRFSGSVFKELIGRAEENHKAP
jgi:hypothetical protein